MSIFTNAKVIGPQIDTMVYRSAIDETGKPINRGDARFPMTRSDLMNFAECPSRWRKGYSRKDSDATDWGNLFDLAVLSPEKAAQRIITTPELYPCEPTKQDPRTEKPWNRNAKFVKDWEAERVAAGCTVLTPAEREKLDSALGALATDPDITELLACSQRQVMVVGEFKDPETKIVVPVKCLLDLVPDPKHQTYGRCLADLKSSVTANPLYWPNLVDKYGYAMQAALYLDMFVAATEEDRTDWLHAIQENFWPWETGKRLLSLEFLDLGRRKYRQALADYCKCLDAGKWPGYDTGPHGDDWTLCEPDQRMMERAMRALPELEEPDEDEDQLPMPLSEMPS